MHKGPKSTLRFLLNARILHATEGCPTAAILPLDGLCPAGIWRRHEGGGERGRADVFDKLQTTSYFLACYIIVSSSKQMVTSAATGFVMVLIVYDMLAFPKWQF
jgi:hypothetical protein